MSWILASVAFAEPMVHALEVAVGDHSVALPFASLAPAAPVHPAIRVGAQHVWMDRRFDLVQTVRIDGRLHPLAGNAIGVGTDLDLRWTSGVGPLVEAGLGLALYQVVRQRAILTLDESSGEYVSRRGPGRPSVAPGFDVAVGMDLGEISSVPVTLLLDYTWSVQTGFLPALPLGPQGTLSAGFRLPLGRSS